MALKDTIDMTIDIRTDMMLKVSIIINNYNYDRFLPAAIDSALNQTYPHTEVIVVDDGSTDRSPTIIAQYQSRIRPILKPNGGQASAFNAGFAISQGDIVIFLDSDDMLLPDTAQQVVNVWQQQPDIAKVQYQLQVMDGEGHTTDKIIPDRRYMPSGDLRSHIVKFHSYGCPPTSGNAFSAAYLRQIMPMPEHEYRIVADEYINNLIPVLGSIVSLHQVGALYRMHGNNHFCSPIQGMEEPERLRRNLRINLETRDRQRKLFNERYATHYQNIGIWEVAYLKTRITSLKLDRPNHPLPQDKLLPLCIQGCIAALISPYMRLRGRALFIFWFLGMLMIPTLKAKSFTEVLLYPEERKRLKQVLLSRFRPTVEA
jgi:glycosyltransferase involved in cell wall biosynthesis